MGHTRSAAILTLLLSLCSVRAAAQSWTLVPTEAGQVDFQTPDTNRVAGNVAVFDADGDGDLDLLWTMAPTASLRLDRNESVPGTFHFEDATAAAAIAPSVSGAQGLGVGDFDGDGRTDVYVAQPGADRLLVARPDGTFEDVTATHLGGDMGLSSAPAVADFDGDGDLDIYVGRYVGIIRFPYHIGDRNLMLVNDGRGHFTDRAPEWGLDDAGSALAAAWVDVDEDGDLDLLLANDFGCHAYPHRAWRNDGPEAGGGWRFTDVSAAWHFGRGLYGMGIGVVDANRDGHLDYYLTSIGRHVLLTGPPSPWLVERTDELGVANTFGPAGHRSSWGAAVLDVDGDGYDDLYVRAGLIPAAAVIATSQTQQDRAWSLGSDGRLHDVRPGRFPTTINRSGRGVVAADLDGDGAVEIVASAANDFTHIYTGGGDPDPIAVRLEATVSAPGAPGARLWLTCGASPAKVNLRQMSAGGSLGSASPPGEAWIPVPERCAAGGTLHVLWPTGATSSAGVVPGDHAVMVEPAWLQLEPAELVAGSDAVAQLTAMPIGPDGEALGPGHELAVYYDDGTLAATLDDQGDETYVAVLPAPAEVGAVSLFLDVDGERWPVSRTLRGVLAEPVPSLTVYPRHLVAGRDATVIVEWEGAATLGLSVDGTPVDVTSEGPGRAMASVAVPEGEATLALQPVVDGAPEGPPVELPIEPRLDPVRSWFEVDYPFWTDTLGPTDVQITTLRLVDTNGWPVEAESSELTLLEDGTPLGATIQSLGVDRYRVVPSRALYPSTELGVELWGQVLGPIPIRPFTGDAELIAAVEPARSELGAYFEGCRADGSDTLVVTVLPRTPEGHPLPEIGDFELDVEGAEVIDGPSQNRLGMYELTLRCGTETGWGLVTLRLGGVLTGLEHRFHLFAPRDVAADPSLTELRTPTGPVEFGSPAYIEVIPHEATGDRAGSGLEVTLWNDALGDWLDVPYCGVGVYCLYLYGPPGGGLWQLTAYVDGQLGATGQSVWFLREFAEPEPDAGPGTDAGSGDVDSGDAAADAGSGDTGPGDTGPGDAGDAADAVELDVAFDSGTTDAADTSTESEPGAHGDSAGDGDGGAASGDLADDGHADSAGDADGSAAGARGGADGGCGCRTTGGAGPGAWLLVPLALLWRRRAAGRGPAGARGATSHVTTDFEHPHARRSTHP